MVKVKLNLPVDSTFLTEEYKIALKHAIEKIKIDFKSENLVTLLKED